MTRTAGESLGDVTKAVEAGRLIFDDPAAAIIHESKGPSECVAAVAAQPVGRAGPYNGRSEFRYEPAAPMNRPPAHHRGKFEVKTPGMT
jgi:hypothetical protein